MYISREISEAMSTNARDQMYGTSMPKGRHFIPTPKFWTDIKKIQQDNNITMFIDCGTGGGEIPKEARTKHNIKMAGVDIWHREGNDRTEVQLMPAHQLEYSESIWPMVCRPDHSGWVRALIEKALEENSGFIYVGLRKNMALDLSKYLIELEYETYENVGEENEQILVFKPV